MKCPKCQSEQPCVCKLPTPIGCPFCASKNDVCFYHNNKSDHGGAYCICMKCGATGPTVASSTEEANDIPIMTMSIQAWNRRAL